MIGCEQFLDGSRQRAICEGTADLTLHKINRYRKRWGLPPLIEKPEGAAEPIPRSFIRQSTVNPPKPPIATRQKLLGDRVEQVLTAVGVTEKRVSKWLGHPCGCAGRKRKLNLFDTWLRKKAKGLFGSDEEARDELIDLIE